MQEPTISETVLVITEAFEGSAVARWGRLIADTLALRPKWLIVDLEHCLGLDAAAIMTLLQTHRTIVAAGGHLTLRHPSAKVRRMLVLARVEQVFDIQDGASPNAPAPSR